MPWRHPLSDASAEVRTETIQAFVWKKYRFACLQPPAFPGLKVIFTPFSSGWPSIAKRGLLRRNLAIAPTDPAFHVCLRCRELCANGGGRGVVDLRARHPDARRRRRRRIRRSRPALPSISDGLRPSANPATWVGKIQPLP